MKMTKLMNTCISSMFIIATSNAFLNDYAILSKPFNTGSYSRNQRGLYAHEDSLKSDEKEDETLVPLDHQMASQIKTSNRRGFLYQSIAFATFTPTIANAKQNLQLPVFGTMQEEATMVAKSLTGEAAVRAPLNVARILRTKSLSSESCLLSLLPVSNRVFRNLQQQIEDISVVRQAIFEELAWRSAETSANNALLYLDAQRRYLEPKFNENDTPMMQIEKGIRAEDLIESIRDQVIKLQRATSLRNETLTYEIQKNALLTMAYLGELLVQKFPYQVPKKGKYSYLPRLLGRALVTFGMERNGKFLGNITIIADGYTAPITAGNFVDLSVRGFYTGLPVKNMKKRLYSTKDKFVEGNTFLSNLGNALKNDEIDDPNSKLVNLNIMGSCNEGFYDPLTAKLRRLPLEILRIDKTTGVAEPTYPKSFAGAVPMRNINTYDDTMTQEEGTEEENKPVLNFDFPGLVAMNHPDRILNGASSEFFVLSKKEMDKETNDLLDGKYAPFGFVVEGYDLIQKLQAGDTIKSTYVSEWGISNLVKIKGTNLQDLMRSDES